MKERSGMPYDVVAFDTDEDAKFWTNQQEGAFHRLMRHAWINGGIPDDLPKIASICRESVSQMNKLWPAIEPKWPVDPMHPSRRVNPKQESEREFKQEKSGKAAESAAKRWEKERHAKAEQSSNANAMRTHMPKRSEGNAPLPVPPLPSPIGEANLINNSPNSKLAISSPEVRYSAPFQLFWSRSTRRGPKPDAFREWQKLRVDGVLIAKINHGMAAWMGSEQWQDETKQAHIHRWLKRRGWEEEVPKSNGSGSHGSYKDKQQLNAEAAHRLLSRLDSQAGSGDERDAPGGDPSGLSGSAE